MQIDEGYVVLFKSTSTWEYRKRILNALAMPEGMLWSTHYRKKYCSPEIQETVFGKKGICSLRNMEGVLIFADIESNPALFFPLRTFKIIDWYREGENWVVQLSFGRYVSSYEEKNFKEFQNIFRQRIKLLPPKDQSWAQVIPHHKKTLKELFSSEGIDIGESFRSIVSMIWKYSDRKCFQICSSDGGKGSVPEYSGKPAVFYRIELSKLKRKGEHVPADQEKGLVILNLGARYEFMFHYFAPEPNSIDFEDNFNIDLHEELSRRIGSVQILHGTASKDEAFEWRMDRHTNQKIRFEIKRDLRWPLAPEPVIFGLVKRGLIRRVNAGHFLFVTGLLLAVFSLFLASARDFLIVVGTTVMSSGAALIGSRS